MTDDRSLHVVMNRLAALLAAVALLAPAAARAQQAHYVSPSGDDDNPGTREEPWATLTRGTAGLSTGDTLVLKAGKYPTRFRVYEDGTAEQPIVVRSAEGQTATLTGGHDGSFAVQLAGRSYIRIEDLHISPEPIDGGRWMNIVDASYITLDHVLMEHAVNVGGLGNVPFNILGSDHVRILNSTIQEKLGGADMTHIYNSHHLLFEGNTIRRSGHSPLAISPRHRLAKSTDHVIMRGNVFPTQWGRAFGMEGTPDFLFENNIITHEFHSRHSASGGATFMIEDGVVRFNRVFRNWDGALNLGFFLPAVDSRRVGYYNNVFDFNYDRVMRAETIHDYVFKNNIFSRNDPYGGGRTIQFESGGTSFEFTSNDFWAGEDNETMFDAETGPPLEDHNESGKLLTLETVSSAGWRGGDADRSDNVFRDDNLNVKPGYVDAENYNHALERRSPLRNAGEALTTATGGGSGTELPVEDARYFYGGFDIRGEQGDLIAVGADQQKARVTGVDRDDNTLTLDREISWAAGDPVGLPWAREAPDMGVYEYGESGRPSVQITTEPFRVEPGEDVELRAVVRGNAEPASYHWRIRDQRLSEDGSSVTHSFDFNNSPTYSPGGASVFCRVVTTAGDTLLGTGFVEFEKANVKEQPLVAHTYEGDPYNEPISVDVPKNNWWWFWYRSRPSVRLTREVVEGHGGVGRFTAEQDNYDMGVRAWPGQWDLDTYPQITFRYRIDEDLPLGFYVQGFDDGKQDRQRYLALAPGANPSGIQALDDPKVLENDGDWHQITLDARRLREAFPDVNVIEKMRFEAVNESDVEKGDSFWLDAFYIAPEDYQVSTQEQEGAQFDLGQNYPNPLGGAGTTTIPYEVPSLTKVRLTVYDVLGRRVATLVDERKQAGAHEVSLDGRGLASGLYVYRIETDAATKTRKMIVVR